MCVIGSPSCSTCRIPQELTASEEVAEVALLRSTLRAQRSAAVDELTDAPSDNQLVALGAAEVVKLEAALRASEVRLTCLCGIREALSTTSIYGTRICEAHSAGI